MRNIKDILSNEFNIKEKQENPIDANIKKVFQQFKNKRTQFDMPQQPAQVVFPQDSYPNFNQQPQYTQEELRHMHHKTITKAPKVIYVPVPEPVFYPQQPQQINPQQYYQQPLPQPVPQQQYQQIPQVPIPLPSQMAKSQSNFDILKSVHPLMLIGIVVFILPFFSGFIPILGKFLGILTGLGFILIIIGSFLTYKMRVKKNG